MHIAVACQQLLPAKGYGGPQRVVVALVRGSRRSAIASRCSRHRARESPKRLWGRASAQAGRSRSAPHRTSPRRRDRTRALPVRGGPARSPSSRRSTQPEGRHCSYPNSIFLSRDTRAATTATSSCITASIPRDYVFRVFPGARRSTTCSSGSSTAPRAITGGGSREAHRPRLIVAGAGGPASRIDQVRR